MAYRLISLCFVVVCVASVPAPADVGALEHEHYTVIPIVSQTEELEANGTFKFSYETGNGIKWEEISYDKTLPKIEGRSAGGGDGDTTDSNEVHVQQGSYSYVAPDGTVISLRYIADENGFQPVGDHIPTPPSFVNAQVNIAREKSGRALNVEAPVVAVAQKEPISNVVQSTPKVVEPVASAAPEPIKPEVQEATIAEEDSSGGAAVSPTPNSNEKEPEPESANLAASDA
ncbi:hypothetical protein ACJJTC_015776 [Scirpophaga incertulas]